MGLLSLWDAAFSRVRANEKLHLAWCCGGVIGCLVAYGVLQVRAPPIENQNKASLAHLIPRSDALMDGTWRYRYWAEPTGAPASGWN